MVLLILLLGIICIDRFLVLNNIGHQVKGRRGRAGRRGTSDKEGQLGGGGWDRLEGCKVMRTRCEWRSRGQMAGG